MLCFPPLKCWEVESYTFVVPQSSHRHKLKVRWQAFWRNGAQQARNLKLLHETPWDTSLAQLCPSTEAIPALLFEVVASKGTAQSKSRQYLFVNGAETHAWGTCPPNTGSCRFTNLNVCSEQCTMNGLTMLFMHFRTHAAVGKKGKDRFLNFVSQLVNVNNECYLIAFLPPRHKMYGCSKVWHCKKQKHLRTCFQTSWHNCGRI